MNCHVHLDLFGQTIAEQREGEWRCGGRKAAGGRWGGRGRGGRAPRFGREGGGRGLRARVQQRPSCRSRPRRRRPLHRRRRERGEAAPEAAAGAWAP